MAKKKPSALNALIRLDEERAALNEREAALKREAALELGSAVLTGGGAILRPDRLRQLVERIVSVGSEEALRRLSVAPPSSKAVSPKPGNEVPSQVTQDGR